jgi:hypothetical protein
MSEAKKHFSLEKPKTILESFGETFMELTHTGIYFLSQIGVVFFLRKRLN